MLTDFYKVEMQNLLISQKLGIKTGKMMMAYD